MMSSLFRKQVQNKHVNRLYGDVFILPRLSYVLISICIFIWVLILFIWLVTSTYARKESVRGWLEPEKGIIRTYASTQGIINEVLVQEGEEVIKEQPLLIINGDILMSDGTHMETILLNEYKMQKQRIEQQIIRMVNSNLRRRQDIQQRLDSSLESLQLLDEQLTTLDKQHNLVSNHVKRYQDLNKKGNISTIELNLLVEKELDLKREQQSLSRNRVTQLNTIQQLQTEKDLLPLEQARILDEQEEQLSNIAVQVIRLQGQREYIVKASRSGVINNLQAIKGQRAQTNTPLLNIIPNNSKLKVNLLVPVRSIAFVEPGQILDIRYDAFPYQKFGLYSGTVNQVSESIILPDEFNHSGVPISEPVYRITANLLNNNVKAYGRYIPLKVGMTLTADIQLGERTLFQWLLEPIYSLKGQL